MTYQTIEGEANLAERIREEREERGWSHSELARRMAEAGCAGLPRNAMLRAERRERGISVDELVALSRVFELPVNNLLTSVEWLRQERADKLLNELRAAHDAVRAHAVRKLELILDLVDLAAAAEGDSDAVGFLVAHGAQWYETGSGNPLFEVRQDDGTPADVDDTTLREALVALDWAVFAQARQVLAASEGDSGV